VIQRKFFWHAIGETQRLAQLAGGADESTRRGRCSCSRATPHPKTIREAQRARRSDKLTERKLIERAKGLLMKKHGLDEEAAYGLLPSN
jgi:hypothetical protein